MSTEGPDFQKKEREEEKAYNIIWTKHLILQISKLSLSRVLRGIIREIGKMRAYDSKSN